MKYLLTTVIFFSLFIMASPAHAVSPPNGSGANIVYTPLEPIVPGSETGNITLPQLLNTLFRVLMSVGALIAVVSLTFAGIEVMVSEIPVVKKVARERAWAAVFGLLLLAGAYLILYTINPCLTSFSFLDTDINAKCPSLKPTTTSSDTSTNPSPGNTDQNGSGVGGTSSYGVCAPPPVTKTVSPLVAGYTIGSNCGSLVRAQGFILVETDSLGAVIVTKKSNASTINVQQIRDDFIIQCESAEGSVKPVTTRADLVMYACVQ